MTERNGNLEWSDPANHDRAWLLALRMYEHLQREGLAGLPMADAAAALAMLNGLFLAGAYEGVPDREMAMQAIGKNACVHARQAATLFKRVRADHGGSA